jgi:hypothetical protein
MNDRMYVRALPLAVALLENDIATGQSGYQGVRLSPNLTGLPRVARASVFLWAPAIARDAANAAGLDGAAIARVLVLEETERGNVVAVLSSEEATRRASVRQTIPDPDAARDDGGE